MAIVLYRCTWKSCRPKLSTSVYTCTCMIPRSFQCVFFCNLVLIYVVQVKRHSHSTSTVRSRLVFRREPDGACREGNWWNRWGLGFSSPPHSDYAAGRKTRVPVKCHINVDCFSHRFLVIYRPWWTWTPRFRHSRDRIMSLETSPVVSVRIRQQDSGSTVPTDERFKMPSLSYKSRRQQSLHGHNMQEVPCKTDDCISYKKRNKHKKKHWDATWKDSWSRRWDKSSRMCRYHACMAPNRSSVTG